MSSVSRDKKGVMSIESLLDSSTKDVEAHSLSPTHASSVLTAAPSHYAFTPPDSISSQQPKPHRHAASFHVLPYMCPDVPTRHPAALTYPTATSTGILLTYPCAFPATSLSLSAPATTCESTFTLPTLLTAQPSHQHQPFGCPICRRGFKRKHHLESHLTTHTAECPYKCNLRNERGVCTSKFKRQGDLARHQRNVHK